MGTQGGSKSGGGNMPNPQRMGMASRVGGGIGAPGDPNAPLLGPNGPQTMGAQTSMGAGITDPMAKPGAGPGRMGWQGGDGRAFAGGSGGFNEAGGPAIPMNPGPVGGPNQGAAPDIQLQGDILQKRWNGDSGTVPNPVPLPPTSTLPYQPPGAPPPNSTPPGSPPVGGGPGGPPTPPPGITVPGGMNAGDWTGKNTTGNSTDAINAALFSGNQGPLSGQGSQATNSAVNAQSASSNNWRPGDVSVAGSKAGYNTPAAMFQQGYLDKGMAVRGPGGAFQWTQAGLDAMKKNSGQR